MSVRQCARRALPCVALAVIALVFGPWAAAQEKPLDNAEIVKLVKLDMGDAVIIAKIRAAKEVQFQTTTDDLVKLKDEGVSKAVIAAMLERLGPGPSVPTTSPAGADPRVTLETKDGSIELKAIFGNVKSQSSFFGVVSWLHFNDYTAKIRTKDRRPSFLLESDKDPRGGWWYVKVSQDKREDDDYRYFDLEGGGPFGIVWSGSPEKGSVVKYDATQERPGVWRLIPVKTLSPGEYGLFSGKREGVGLLFDFGIDK